MLRSFRGFVFIATIISLPVTAGILVWSFDEKPIQSPNVTFVAEKLKVFLQTWYEIVDGAIRPGYYTQTTVFPCENVNCYVLDQSKSMQAEAPYPFCF